MYISKIHNAHLTMPNAFVNKNSNQLLSKNIAENSEYIIPTSNISFRAYIHPKRTIPDINYEDYVSMKPHKREFYRKRINDFDKILAENENDIFDKKYKTLPLKTERNMDEFLKTSKIYTKYKEQPIICLGRSPKWFLNTALWMKDGIDNYNFVAFSKFWYWPDKQEGMRRMASVAPTKEEITAYRKYLNRIQADPKTIVENYEKTGKKTVITDYISTGKGVTSFLEILSDYADDLGLLEKFSKSIQIVGIGSIDYLESRNMSEDEISRPKVIMPLKLCPYGRNIKQEFYNMNPSMFEEMLINQNTNECRSSYYPHEAWTVYNPDRFKTGLIKDMKKVRALMDNQRLNEKTFNNFSPKLGDFRNFLQFRILDALNIRGILRETHVKP